MSLFFPNNGKNSHLIPKWESRKVSCDRLLQQCSNYMLYNLIAMICQWYNNNLNDG